MKKPNVCEMSLREKIGQTAVAYCHNDYTKLDGEKPWGSLYVSGGMRFKEFNARFDDVAEKGAKAKDWVEFINNADKKLKVPILGVTDNAIGLFGMFPEIPKLATCTSIGAADSEELAYKSGYARGLQMRAVGARWWWGPDVDISAWKCPIAATREFSDDYKRIIRLAGAMIKGCMDAGVAPTAKHFPGSDPLSTRDTHISEGINYLSVEDWEKENGEIYRTLIAAGVPSIMITHSAFPAVDPSMVGGGYRPSSISYPVITEFLKGKLGFEGAVVTDGLSMRSLVTALDESMERVYIEAFKAGNDFMLGCEDYYIDCIEKAVLDGEISMERVDDACRRVLDLKEKIGMFEDSYEASGIDFEYMVEYCEKLNKELADQSINLVCDKKELLPVKKENIKSAAIIYFCPNESVRAQYAAVKRELEARGAKVTVYPTLTSREQMKEISDNNDLIIYLAHYGVNGTFVDPEYRAFYYALLAGSEKSVVIATGEHTMYYEFFARFPAFINAFSASDEVLSAAISKIYGESEFKGILPFSLYPPQILEYLKDKPYGFIG